MALKEFYIGTVGPYYIDDTDPLYSDSGQVVTRSMVDGIVAPGSSVTGETSFGQAASAGISDDYSRSDHTHGTPANPVSGFTGTLNFDATTTGRVTSMTFSNGLLQSYTTLP